jgi:RNA polymerase sigma-70 factor (ECF subfamily)
VILIADGGESAATAPVPIHGAELVARMLARPNRNVSMMWLNGAPAVRVESDRQPAVVSLVVEDGLISRIYAMANPDKLTRLNEPAELAR